MEDNFEDIVREYYIRLREPFMRRLTMQFPSMRLGAAEDLYQDAFLAVQANLQRGKVRPDTDWNAYILKIGMNMASKGLRDKTVTVSGMASPDDEHEQFGDTARRVDAILKELPEEETAFCNNTEVLSLLGNELDHTPEPCATIIRLFYYNDASMEEIAKKTGLKNAQTAKVKKSQCMTDLIKRVTTSLQRSGFDMIPKKRNRNGRN
ncbi:MAG: sigma-70 family RNA polymerase sigma factor [Muribaculaceae bacterium]|nr:sigma-70 family RNA polymerase sigma factor [Muribaculaceae bacterium]